MASLFHPRVLRAQLSSFRFPSDLDARRARLRPWIERLHSGELAQTNEVQLHGPFLQGVFGEVLGYRGWDRPSPGFDLHQEVAVRGGKQVDGAIGWFGLGAPRIHVPIELKGAAQNLDAAGSRRQTPVEQAWGYANATGGCRWIIVSNYRETRLYSTARSTEDYERFLLSELLEDEPFRRFWLLLSREALLPASPVERSRADELLLASEKAQDEVTDTLYDEYRALRVNLFEHLTRAHPNLRPVDLLRHTQKLLDRFLFIAFAEDRGLLPRETIARALDHVDDYNPRPVWDNLKAVFRWVDKGNPARNFPPYNGGLFAEDPDLDALEVSDEACRWLKALAHYDFGDDVSVDVLGHIFEQSITDLEELRAEAAGGAATLSKRKAEGVFYTPAFVTRYIVEETLGRAFAERFDALHAELNPEQVRGANKKTEAWITLWTRYRDWLRTVRVVDPACGSGAFLIAAFDRMHAEYERVNASLAELRGGQRELFDLNKVILNQNLFGMDLNPESVEITKLSLWLKTAQPGKKLTWLDGNIRCGNSVVDDPRVHPRAVDWSGHLPYVLFGEVDESEAVQVDASWREGFDVVLGNPPYVRQELLTPYKEHWKSRFAAYDGVADLYVYFFELGLNVLKPGGRLGFVVANKWLKAGYAGPLRALLASTTEVETLIDFGHAPIFRDADAFPSIITMRRATPAAERRVTVTRFPREELGLVSVPEFVRAHAEQVPQARLGRDSWSLEDDRVERLMAKLRERGVGLADYAGCRPVRGVLTGFNEAFLIDGATRARLLREDPGSANLIYRFLRGANIDRWAAEWDEEWMIFARRGVEIARYPAVLRHLEGYRAQLEPKPPGWEGKDWPGRKPGRYAWYEIQDAVDYWECFTRPKIVYQEIQFHPCYALDSTGVFSNNKVFLIPSSDPWLLAVLNSALLWWHNTRYLPHMKDEALNPRGDLMERLPIAPPSAADRALAEALVPTVCADVAANHQARRGMVALLRAQHGVDKAGEALKAFHHLDADGFVAEVMKRRPRSAGKLRPADLLALRALHEEEALPILRREHAIALAERRLSDAVNAAFGLSDEDLATLRATAPPRMPPGLPA
ncbi:MAG: N-6 DNA methylase [Deltaproteobacteria bacterium]|nr:N-6 DNA methylase [Deltaproteobacteria bacterium]